MPSDHWEVKRCTSAAVYQDFSELSEFIYVSYQVIIELLLCHI